MQLHRQSFLYVLFILLIPITLLHFTGVKLYLYWTYEWFDLVIHFLFGLWVGLAGLWLLFLSSYFGTFTFRSKVIFPLTLLLVGVVGVGWEVFEVWAGIPIKEGYVLDTALDLFMDTLGALFGLGFFLYSKNKHTNFRDRES